MSFARVFPGSRALLVVLALGVAPAGCVFGKPPPVAETGETFHADPTVPVAPFVEWVGTALSDVTLRPEQQRVLQVRGNALKARHRPQMEARARLAELAARQVEEGNVIPASLDEARQYLAAACDDVAQDDVTALVDLHDTLDDAQRKAFTAAVRARIDRQPTDVFDVKTRYLLWRQELAITPEQQGRIFMTLGLDEASLRQMRAESEQRGAFLKEVLTAFEQPTFDPSVAQKGETQGALSARRTGRVVQYLAAAAPILSLEQRVRAANLLRSRSGMPGDDVVRPQKR